MISRSEILKGLSCPEEFQDNLESLVEALNLFQTSWQHPMIVTSGYRTQDHNKAVGGRQNSAHLSCQAADIADSAGLLADFCRENAQTLEQCGLYMEDPSYTPGWVHLQIRPTRNLIFIP